jgi:hypothetical protein
MARTNQSKRLKTTSELISDSHMISPHLRVETPRISHTDTTVDSLQLENQNSIPPNIPNEVDTPTLLLLPAPIPRSLTTDTAKDTTLLDDVPTNEDSKLPAAIVPPINRMIPTPPKGKQTAISILMTTNQQLFGFSFANVYNMNAMIGHLGENEQFFGGERFRYFSNLTSTWIKDSPLGGLNLWFLSINHDNDHLGSTFPTNHVGTNYSVYMAFAKKIGRTGMNAKKVSAPVIYCVRVLKEREETDLASIIAQKAAERAAVRQAALEASAPTNQDLEDMFN